MLSEEGKDARVPERRNRNDDEIGRIDRPPQIRSEGREEPPACRAS